MRHRTLISISIVMLICSCSSKREETLSPTIAPITEAVFASGHIESKNQFTMIAMSDGYIKEVRVLEGDHVTTGQTLIVQDNTASAIAEQTAAANLNISEQLASEESPVLQQLKNELSSANQKLQADKMNLERMQRLYSTHSVAKIDLDNAELSFATSANKVATIQQNIESTKLSLKQTAINSRSQLRSAAVNNDYFNIKSPGDYRVFSLLKNKGELVRKGEAVAILGKPDMKIVLNVDENSISKVKENQTVLVELNTDKGRVQKAKVSKIHPAFDVSSQSYRVEALFDSVSGYVLNGTLLQANIIVAQKDKAMLIPRNSLKGEGVVWVKKRHNTDTQAIRVGIVSNEWVEVLSGLNERDKIIK